MLYAVGDIHGESEMLRELLERLPLSSDDRLIFVGRACAAVLARERDVLHVRLVASEAYRIRNAIEHLGVPEADARRVLQDSDSNRERYHREFYGRDWSDPVLYHMVLNTGLLGIDGAAKLIEARARELDW